MNIRFEKEGGVAGIFLEGTLANHEIPDDLRQVILDNLSMIEEEQEAENPYVMDLEAYKIEIDDLESKTQCAFSTSNPASFRNMIARKIVREYVRRELRSLKATTEEE